MAHTDLELAVFRHSAFCENVVRPAITGSPHALEAGVLHCADPIAVDAAAGGTFALVPLGYRWGPVWSTAWFRLRGSIPTAHAGRACAVRFDCGTEALWWDAGVPRRGFDRFRDLVLLTDSAEPGTPVDLLIEAACNHPLGASLFSWTDAATRERWSTTTPGRLDAAELVVFDRDVWTLHTTLRFAIELLRTRTERDPEAGPLGAAVAAAVARIPDDDPGRYARAVTDDLRRALRALGPASASTCIAAGHAHIDTAWLWPLRETRRKCLRSFANVLELMDRHDDFRFICSQPQQYAWVEDDCPELFAQIEARVRSGHWEPIGAMWIEPDANVPSAESLLRQILHGTRYFASRFGADAEQRVLFLPDTFGFPAGLPQIMAHAGLDLFVTNKLSWSQSTTFPHQTFRWRGIDGTEVLAHNTPGHDYNSANTVDVLQRGATNDAAFDRGRTRVWLQPFGYGDGGGGPTDAAIERAQLAHGGAGLPAVRLGGMTAFREQLHAAWDRCRADGDDLPVWDGELYLQFHRGVLTTHAWLKRANARAESRLRALEWLLCAGPAGPSAAAVAQTADERDAIWKTVLLHQFHDILPGTSIAAVYADVARDHDAVAAVTARLTDAALEAWRDRADTNGLAEPVLLLNPSSHARGGVVSLAAPDADERLVWVDPVPAVGATTIDTAHAVRTPAAATCDGTILANEYLTATIDDLGRITHLADAAGERAAAPLNDLRLYEDHPMSWDAWDIDADYATRPVDRNPEPGRRTVLDLGPLRAGVAVERKLGAASSVVIRITLDAGARYLDVRLDVDWREDHRLLRVAFPADIRARTATYGIQGGCLERPTHRNTRADAAAFEVCLHRWMDLSEPGRGLAVATHAIYGGAVHGGELSLSLLRSPRFPDPTADRRTHRLRYRIIPHAGDWRAAGVDHLADNLSEPLRALPLPSGRSGTLPRAWAPLTWSGPGAAGLALSAWKPAEDGEGAIVRLIERHGRRGDVRLDWNVPVTHVSAQDGLERDAARPHLEHAGRATTFTVRPFEIVTLRVR